MPMRLTMFVFSLVIPVLTAPPPEEKKDKEKRDTYTAVAQGIRGPVAGRSMSLTFRIDKYTSDQEVLELANLLKEKGVDALRKKLEKIRVGKVSPPGTIGNDIAVARVRDLGDGNKRVILMTARYMRFFELYYTGRSKDYPFGWFELYINEEGKGQGSVIVAARPQFNKEGVLEVESYGLQPIRLSNVRDRTKK